MSGFRGLRKIQIQTHLFLLLADTFLMQKNLCNKLPVIKPETQISFLTLFFTAHVFCQCAYFKELCASIFLLNKNIGRVSQALCKALGMQGAPNLIGKRRNSYIKNGILGQDLMDN